MQDLLREKKVAKTRTRHLLISLLSVGLVWLVMTVLFCGAQIFSICDRYAWLLFIYGIPISGIVAQVFCALWSNQLSQIFACSLIIWGAGLSLHLTAPVSYTHLIRCPGVPGKAIDTHLLRILPLYRMIAKMQFPKCKLHQNAILAKFRGLHFFRVDLG